MEWIFIMKNLRAWFWLAVAALMVLPVAAAAETVYVSENFEITMRTGPGTERKIISLVQSGKALEVLEKGEEWSLVRDHNGKEGWVLNRYLTTDQPSAMVLERVRQDYDVLSAKYKDLKEKYSQLESQKKVADADLSQNSQDLSKLSADYENLKKESADFLALKKRYEKTAADLEAEKNRSAQLDEENMQMKRNRIIQWVWTGGGLIFAGFLLGLFSSSRRKPRSSLY